jgi:hypothetical protein
VNATEERRRAIRAEILAAGKAGDVVRFRGLIHAYVLANIADKEYRLEAAERRRQKAKTA